MGCWLAKKKKTLVSVFFLLMHEHFDFRVCTREIFLFSFFFFPIFFNVQKVFIAPLDLNLTVCFLHFYLSK